MTSLVIGIVIVIAFIPPAIIKYNDLQRSGYNSIKKHLDIMF